MSKKFLGMQDRASKVVPSAPPKITTSGNDRRIVDIPLNKLYPAAWNARKYFDEESMAKLVADLKRNGQIQAIVVRPKGEDFEVIVGNRRLRAAEGAGFKTLRSEIRQLDDSAARYLSFAENLQRADLNPFEETLGYLGMLQLLLENEPLFQAFKQQEEPDERAVERLLRRYANEKQRLENNVILKTSSEKSQKGGGQSQVLGTPLEVAVQTVFATVEHMTWQSFVKNRLPLLKMPSDIIFAVQNGSLDYTKARRLGRVKDDSIRKLLLHATETEGLSLDEVSARVQRAMAKLDIDSSRVQDNLSKRSKVVANALKKSRELEKPKLKKAERLLGELEKLLGIEDNE